MKKILIAVVLMILMAMVDQALALSWRELIEIPEEVEALTANVTDLQASVTALEAQIVALNARIESLETDRGLLKEGLFIIGNHVREKLVASIAYISTKPDGYMVRVSDPNSPTGRSRIPRDTCVADNNAALVLLQEFMDYLSGE